MSLSPETPAHRSGTDLAEYTSAAPPALAALRVLPGRRHRGAAVLRFTPPAYTATTQVLVSPIGVQDQSNQVPQAAGVAQPRHRGPDRPVGRRRDKAAGTLDRRCRAGRRDRAAQLGGPVGLGHRATPAAAAHARGLRPGVPRSTAPRPPSTRSTPSSGRCPRSSSRSTPGSAPSLAELPALTKGTAEQTIAAPAAERAEPPGLQPHRQVRRAQDHRRHARLGDQPTRSRPARPARPACRSISAAG